MRISGLQKLSMVDFPGKLAATVFTGGCNLRCPFCHNALLVTRLAENPESHTIAEVLDFLRSRRGFLDGVVLSGGEPLLQPDVADFARAVRELGFAFKLDTNGFFPQRLRALIDEQLVDYVAMDIKNAPQDYSAICGIPDLDPAPVLESVELLREGRVAYEFRTTLVRGFHNAQRLAEIGAWLPKDCDYYLQSFRDSGDLIQPGLEGFSEAEMAQFQELLRPLHPRTKLRGI